MPLIRPSKDYERLDPTLFRAFTAAAETLNFTRAATKAAMTQSGVSQHIAKLEAQLKVALFTRTNKSVLLTDAGRRLVLYIERYLDETDTLCEILQDNELNLVGRVTYAMPGSCLLSPHLANMLKKRKSTPGIELNILIRSNDEIVSCLLSGIADFGFVTQTIENPGLKLMPFCLEEFVLVIPAGMKPVNSSFDGILAANFVSYPGMEIYFEAWQKHYFPKVQRRLIDSLNVAGQIESIQGAIPLVAQGVGCAIIPRHCVDRELATGELSIYSPDGRRGPLLNIIHIASLAARQQTRRAQQIMDWFFEMHPEVAR